MAKERCKTCNQKIIPKDPRTQEEAIERIEAMGQIVQLTPWMLKFFDWRAKMLDADGIQTTNPDRCVSRGMQYRPKKNIPKSRKQKKRERETREKKDA